jgi:hypothetical protein
MGKRAVPKREWETASALIAAATDRRQASREGAPWRRLPGTRLRR